MNTYQWMLLAVSVSLGVSTAVDLGKVLDAEKPPLLRMFVGAAKFTLSVLGIVTALLWRTQ